MDHAEAIAQIRALREQFLGVPALREKWEASRVYCVAPKDVKMPLHMLVMAGQTAGSLEDALHYMQKIQDILEWIWPSSGIQRFDIFEHGDVRVEIPVASQP